MKRGRATLELVPPGLVLVAGWEVPLRRVYVVGTYLLILGIGRYVGPAERRTLSICSLLSAAPTLPIARTL